MAAGGKQGGQEGKGGEQREEMGGRIPAIISELASPPLPCRCQNLPLPGPSTPALGEWGPILGNLVSREERPGLESRK